MLGEAGKADPANASRTEWSDSSYLGQEASGPLPLTLL